VDDHVAVTAVVANSPEALLEMPQIGGKTKKEMDTSLKENILVGVN
jgi:hypothetical protein